LSSFVQVVDRGSFAAAALEEGVTPVVLGRRITALERRLGVRLLHRSTRRMTPSEDGSVFLGHCRLDPNHVAIKLAANRRVVCGTPAYFKRQGKPKTLEDLQGHNCLAFNLQGGQQHGGLFQRYVKPINVRVRVPARVRLFIDWLKSIYMTPDYWSGWA
jgi:DNA-binding transcriptional LysR family regulator